ncbi:MAG: hypothetical protein PHU21_11085 [Elusimicrobia bacterium]|nr:hypothetical protein [Elusimicrobiota bacterium]
MEAGYAYVARLDCGDLQAPDRCARQAAFLDAHPDVALLGSAVTFFDATGDRFTLHQPQTHEEILVRMHDDNAFSHPAVMFRAAAVRELGWYPEDRPAPERQPARGPGPLRIRSGGGLVLQAPAAAAHAAPGALGALRLEPAVPSDARQASALASAASLPGPEGQEPAGHRGLVLSGAAAG